MFRIDLGKGKVKRLVHGMGLLPILLLLPLISQHDSAGSGDNAAKISSLRTSGNGELRIIEGIPFLKLRGTYYEMGEQYGALLKDEFRRIHAHLMPYRQKWLAKLPSDIGLRLETLTPRPILEQLRGMAAGSGLPFEDLLLGAFWGVLERGGCSSILVKLDPGTKTERLLHGRNYDYGYEMGRFPVVIEYNPREGIKHWVLGTIGYAAAAHGMNARGITVSENMGRGDRKDDDIHHVSPNLHLREMLASVSSLQEAEARMRSYVSDIGTIQTIGSGSENDGIIYDVVYDKISANRFQSSPTLYATSGYLSEASDHLLTCPRYQIIDAYAKINKIRTVTDLISVLSDPGRGHGVNNASTIQSMIFDPRQNMIYLACRDRFAAWGQWLRYDVAKDEVVIHKGADIKKLEASRSSELTEVHIIGAYWQADPNIPKGPVVKRLHFVLRIREWLVDQNVQQLYDFIAKAAKTFTLKAEGRPDIKATITKGTIAVPDFHGFWFMIDDADLVNMTPNVPYTVHVDNISAVYKWVVEDGVILVRKD